jgi:hypothetical protein
MSEPIDKIMARVEDLMKESSAADPEGMGTRESRIWLFDGAQYRRRESKAEDSDEPYDGPEWDAVTAPMVRRMLVYLKAHPHPGEIDLNDLCLTVWGSSYIDVNPSSLKSTLCKAVKFLRQRQVSPLPHKDGLRLVWR